MRSPLDGSIIEFRKVSVGLNATVGDAVATVFTEEAKSRLVISEQFTVIRRRLFTAVSHILHLATTLLEFKTLVFPSVPVGGLCLCSCNLNRQGLFCSLGEFILDYSRDFYSQGMVLSHPSTHSWLLLWQNLE